MEEKTKPEIAPEIKPEVKPAPKIEQPSSGVKVTKGGISKYVDPAQVATYKANGWA